MEKRIYLKDGDKTCIGSLVLIRDNKSATGWRYTGGNLYLGSIDNMFFEGEKIQLDENKLPYIKEEKELVPVIDPDGYNVPLSQVMKVTLAKSGIPPNGFICHGIYTVSNCHGYEIMLNDSGDAAKVRYLKDNDEEVISDWLEIKFIEDEDE